MTYIIVGLTRQHFFDFLVVDTPRSSTARRVGKGFIL